MNKNVIIGLIAGVAVLAGAGYFLMQSRPSGMGGTLGDIVEQATLRGLVEAGRPVQCTFSQEEDGVKSEGKVYITRGMMRGDFTTTDSQSQNMAGHMILRDSKTYVWIPEMKQGFVVAMDEESEAANDAVAASYLNYDDALNYNCTTWGVDASKFNLPTDIQFQDIRQMMNAQIPAVDSGGEDGAKTLDTFSYCNSCDSLTGEERAQCRAMLGCL